MSFFDTAKNITNSIVNLMHSVSLEADKKSRRNVQKMSNDELLAVADKQPANKYAKEEIANRGI